MEPDMPRYAFLLPRGHGREEAASREEREVVGRRATKDPVNMGRVSTAARREACRALYARNACRARMLATRESKSRVLFCCRKGSRFHTHYKACLPGAPLSTTAAPAAARMDEKGCPMHARA